jgi:hypothetical protein
MNRIPGPTDIAIMVVLIAVFLIGAIKTGELIYHGLVTIARWVFP